MNKQSYANHVRYYPPHHFIFYPLVTFAIGLSAWFAARRPEHREQWIAITVLFFMVAWVAFMMRQHYALMVQNRVVRLEMRLRYYRLTQQPFEPLEQQLNFQQLAALRFAPDSELLTLIDKSIKEGLDADAIKRSVVVWLPDTMRV